MATIFETIAKFHGWLASEGRTYRLIGHKWPDEPSYMRGVPTFGDGGEIRGNRAWNKVKLERPTDGFGVHETADGEKVIGTRGYHVHIT